MIVRCLICVALCLTLAADPVSAQVARPRQLPARTTSADTRGQLQRPPVNRSTTQAAPQTEQVSPELEQLLREWEQASRRIKRLQGQHMRRVYDMVFHVEKWSAGKFYHEAPDKGRIDIEPVAIKPGMRSSRTDPRTGKPFELIADQQEKWICDGKRIIDIDEKGKGATIISIPPTAQGENIMNGPLPFLFGMPAETAKKRYKLKLADDRVNSKTGRRELVITAWPRLQQDRVNWKEAHIILDHPSYLPLHVKLVDDAGEKETVFSFSNLEVNKIRPFWVDPFRPRLSGYKVATHVPGTADNPVLKLQEGEQIVPDITAYDVTSAKRLQKAGFEVDAKWTRGGPAPTRDLELKVRTCVPPPMTPLKKGSVVKLVVYERTVRQTADRK